MYQGSARRGALSNTMDPILVHVASAVWRCFVFIGGVDDLVRHGARRHLATNHRHGRGVFELLLVVPIYAADDVVCV
jgi:hypothetical protein